MPGFETCPKCGANTLFLSASGSEKLCANITSGFDCGYREFLPGGLVEKAEAFARRAHADQQRDGGEPFIVHPEATAHILSQITEDEEVIAAGWLHDTMEDCDVSYEELKFEFDERVANLVREVTHVRNKDGSAYFPNLKTQQGIMIKFADRLSNLADMSAWSVRRKEAYLLKSKFWGTEPKK